QVTIKCDDAAMSALLPSFTLQPLVENAVKHGIAQRIEGGHLTLNVRCTTDNHIHILVEDNAGLYKPKKEQHAGLGMDIVDKRLIHQFGQQAGLVIECRTNQFTRMSFSIPHTHYHSHQG
ncbi:MAG: sensor histidine kinase, partial [Alteromonas sp.]|nr:sensor histidine kinase [Alteromonas sp.]HCG88635.1 sensor histidine kinase [Alteromonas macleodii]